MKRIFALLTFLVLFTAITCENEPIDEGIQVVEPGGSCEQAVLNTAEAALAFLEINEGNYEQLCNAYRDALEAQILACGDPDGSIQQGIDALGDCTDPGSFDDCEAATEAASLAEINFNNATDDNFEELCNSYRLALENQITECGDDGTIQAILNDLGECVAVAVDGGITFNAGSSPQDFDIITIEEEGNIIKVTAKTSANGASNYEMYFEVMQDETGVDIINDTFYLTLTSTLYPDTTGFNDFTSNITANSTGVLTGTFGGLVRNDDNGVLELTQGMINITY